MRSLGDAPVLLDFHDLNRPDLFAPVPEDWFLFFSDVKNSTQAIQNGLYKSVNVVGASSIMAVLNTVGPDEVAYVFGGDGATFLVPPGFREKIEKALLDTQALAAKNFGLDLRIGCVPVADLRRGGFDLRVARLRDPNQAPQSVFVGSGVMEAERWVKNPAENNRYLITASGNASSADVSGLECRWEAVANRNGEIVNLLVHCCLASTATSQILYGHVIATVERIYGKGSPIQVSQLKLSRKLADYKAEAKARQKTWFYQLGVYLVSNLFVACFERFKSKFWKTYKQELVAQTDYRKFDGTLRMVLDGNVTQRQELEKYLESLRAEGSIAFGIHTSSSALLTCLVLDRKQHHFHFLDGASGGYVEASVQLKKQLEKNPPGMAA